MTGLHHFTPAVMPTLPLEIIWRIISFIKGKNDLHACSLSSQALVNPAQRELFRYILLDGETGEGVYSIMKASCRLAGYVTALELHHKQFGTDTVELLRLLTAVRHVKLLGHTSRDWRKGPILHTLRQLILPHITHLIIEDVSFPISVITTCTRLLSLTVLVSDVVDIELPDVLPSSEPSTKTLHSLQILSLDSIRNRGNAISALFRDLIATGRLSSVGCLRLPPDLDHRSRDDLSHEDLADLLGYFRDTLKCLDIDYWVIPERDEGESIFWTAANPFFIDHFSKLTFLRISMGASSTMKPGRETGLRLSWLSAMINDLTRPHPLSTLVFVEGCDCLLPIIRQEESVEKSLNLAQFQAAWTELDDALHATFGPGRKELRLPYFQRVAFSPLDIFGDVVSGLEDAVQFFTLNLPQCAASNKLVFEETNIEEFYWTLSKEL